MRDEEQKAHEPDGGQDIDAMHPLLAGGLAGFIAELEMGRERVDGES